MFEYHKRITYEFKLEKEKHNNYSPLKNIKEL